MATMRIWWHPGPPIGTSGPQMLAGEPPLSTETVTTSGTAAASGACPEGTTVARCFSDTLTYYLVRRSGVTTAATNTGGRIAASVEKDISVLPGDTISFIE